MKCIASPMKLWTAVLFLMALCSCQTGGGSVSGNERGSSPVNESEVNDYKRAVHKCYKTGGTRVVKINGKLRCYD